MIGSRGGGSHSFYITATACGYFFWLMQRIRLGRIFQKTRLLQRMRALHFFFSGEVLKLQGAAPQLRQSRQVQVEAPATGVALRRRDAARAADAAAPAVVVAALVTA